MAVQPIHPEQVPGQQVGVQAGTAARSRLLYIDNLRILLTVLVVLHHLAIGYGAPGSWYYNEAGPLNIVSAVLLTLYVATDQSFFMGFFFMMSSYFSPSSYDRKGQGSFLADRFRRLGIPLLVFFVLVQPLLVYAVRLYGGYTGSLGTFLIAGWSAGGFGPGPLWFVEALLILNLGYVLWRRVAPSAPSAPSAAREAGRAPRNATIALFAVALGVISFIVRLWIPVGRVWEPLGVDSGLQLGFFPQYIALFILGLNAQKRGWFDGLSTAQARVWARAIPVLALAFLVVGLTGGAMEGGTSVFEGGMHWQALAYAIWEQLMGMAMIVTLIVLFRNRANRQSALARDMSGAAYAAFVVHAPVVVLLALALSGIRADMSLKFVIVAPVAVALTFLVGSALRRVPLTRGIL